jgi:dTDP-4-amino-4,6-dideoxygalactose transaminase
MEPGSRRDAGPLSRSADAFSDLDSVITPAVQPTVVHALRLYFIVLRPEVLSPEVLSINRARFIEELKARPKNDNSQRAGSK